MGLDRFHGRFYLQKDEALYRERQLSRSLQEEAIDEEMVPYLASLNALPHVMTVQCCTGHGPEDERKPHIDIRTSLSFKELFKAVVPLMDRDDWVVSLQVMGWEMGMPRYCFWLDDEHWEAQTALLTECLMGAR